MKVLILLLLLASSAGAQRLPPGTRIGVMKDAKRQLDSIADLTRKTQREQMGCVVVSVMDDTTYVIARLGKAKNVDSTDAVYVYAKTVEMCEWWQPTIHSHVQVEDGEPSPIDQHTSALRDTFGFVLVLTKDGWKLKAYP